MSKEIADILNRAADLIEPEGAWTQGAGARDPEGQEVPESRQNACCWCIGGALYLTTGKPVFGSPAHRVLDRHLGGSFVAFNDAPGRTQAEVVAALRAAAEKEASQ